MTTINHAQRDHALLSASGAKKWINCPPSARLEDLEPSFDSVYTQEGTTAHELAEEYLRNFLKDEKTVFAEDKRAIAEELEPYLDYVIEFYNECMTKHADTTLLLETKLDYSTYVPDGFGTGDVIVLSGNRLTLIDLKFGKGVKVDAVDNPQLRLYGLGAIEAFDDLYEFEEVQMIIHQPRLNHVSEETLGKKELLKWGKNLKPIAKKAYKGEGDFKPGEHCQFCKVKGKCKALADEVLAAVDVNVDEIGLLPKEQLSEILGKLKLIDIFTKAVKEYALDELLKGEEIPGWKVVEGRSNRKYANEETVIDALTRDGFPEEIIFERKLLGITAMEKAIGKKDFNRVLEGLIVKPAGAPTIAPISDARPVYNNHEAILEHLIIDEGE